MSEAEELTGLILAMFAHSDEDQAWMMARLTVPQVRALAGHWPVHAHEGQLPGRSDWRVWLILAGRGFGKTRAGAEWVSELARNDRNLRFALVGATIDEVANVMVRGESGLMAAAREEEDVIWVPSTRTVTFSSGALAFAYGGGKPAKLRGPQHHYAWCDELAKWQRPEETWTNLLLTMRLGKAPQVLVTTTPQPIAILKSIMVDKETVTTRGATRRNPHLPDAYVDGMEARYGGTRLGRQELNGELIEDVEGALWTRDLVERCQAPLHLVREDGEFFTRIVIGVDPPVSAGGDACGIVAVGLGTDGAGYVIGDHSVGGLSPEGWARAVAAAAQAHGADRVVAEANQGGSMVESVLRAADCALPVRLVHARRGKSARAEPVAALFESGRAKFAGAFPELEDELCGLSAGGGYAGPGRSPDRADAMVWAFTELMLGKRKAPAVRGF
jgi:phage terminase large subunit-like protein